MAATAVDAGPVTVKQHGFVVREGPGAAFSTPRAEASAAAAADAQQQHPNQQQQELCSDEGMGATSSGLNRAALGLLGDLAAADRAAYAATYGVSLGLPRAGDVRPAEFAHLTPGVKRLMRSVMRGLKAHQDPEAATEGLGGTYFFRNEAGAKVGIMKPCDEEPLAPNNPKGFVGRQLGEPGLKPTVRVGEAASREVAAYLLDHDRFARVPHTVMVRMSHPVFHLAPPATPGAAAGAKGGASGSPLDCCGGEEEGEGEGGALPLKLGSLQEFAPHECDTSEMGASRFSVRDVQRIGILDIRLYNTDRHAGNILVRHSRGHGGTAHGSMARLDAPPSSLADLSLQGDRYELVPIDHGFALPEELEPPYFEWQHWPQAMMPFGAEELEYIARLDPRADVELLRRELPGLREASLRLLEVCTVLLKKCAAGGLSLAEIAGVVTRPLIGLDDDPSELESVCYAAREAVDAAAAAAAREAPADTASEASGSEAAAELSDLEEVEEEAGEGAGGGLISPTSAFSAATHFRFPPAAERGGGSRPPPDDALFSMDEDGSRTPVPGSPTAEAAAALARLRTSAPGLAVKRSGELSTPGGIVGMSFGSALASADSLPPSYDSGDSPQGPHRAAAANSASMDSTTVAASVGAAFARAATSYVPGFATVAKVRPRGGKARRRRAAGSNGRSRKGLGAQAYPPLVEPRGAGASAAGGGALFSGLDDAQWAAFMRHFVAAVDAALRCGAWSQAAGAKGPAPMMSCPRF